MDLGHGFLPRTCARNYKAVERCLPRDGPGLFNVGLDLPWAILEAPWALQHGASTIELCRDRGVSYALGADLMAAVVRVGRAVEAAVRPDGMNLTSSKGLAERIRAACAGEPS